MGGGEEGLEGSDGTCLRFRSARESSHLWLRDMLIVR